VRKEAKKIGHLHIECPFCGTPTDKMTYLTFCASCGTEWYRNRKGLYFFNDKRKTPKLAFAKALVKIGGVRIGGTA